MRVYAEYVEAPIFRIGSLLRILLFPILTKSAPPECLREKGNSNPLSHIRKREYGLRGDLWQLKGKATPKAKNNLITDPFACFSSVRCEGCDYNSVLTEVRITLQ